MNIDGEILQKNAYKQKTQKNIFKDERKYKHIAEALKA